MEPWRRVGFLTLWRLELPRPLLRQQQNLGCLQLGLALGLPKRGRGAHAVLSSWCCWPFGGLCSPLGGQQEGLVPGSVWPAALRDDTSLTYWGKSWGGVSVP